jgi:hypothetical protein
MDTLLDLSVFGTNLDPGNEIDGDFAQIFIIAVCELIEVHQGNH